MRVLVLANYGMGLYKFRKELLLELLNQEKEVYISLPYDEYVPMLEKIGCKYIQSEVDRRGTDPIKDINLFMSYKNIIKKVDPNIVLTYTIKPNIYGGLACQISKVPYITNITGLGSSIGSNNLLKQITLILYRQGLRKASCVFFQNKPNRHFFISKNLVKNNSRLIPGSGVNLDDHQLEDYPNDDNINFIFIGRVMREKGIEQLFDAIKVVKEKYSNIKFIIIGDCEEDYIALLNEYESNGLLKYYGRQNDIHSFIKNSHATILPSYHEGIANVLLETAASGRPVLCSEITGCIETYDEDLSGFGFEVRNTESLTKAIMKFISLPYDKKRLMGMNGRKKMEQEYDRKIVINAYIDEIEKAVREK